MARYKKRTPHWLRDPEGEIHEFTHISQFCSEHHLNPSSISKILCREQHSSRGWTHPDGAVPRKRNYICCPERSEMVHLYQSGTPVDKIAIKFNRTNKSTQKILIRAGVYQYQKKRWTALSQERKQEIIRRFLGGESRLQIAREMSVSYTIVFRTLQKEGVVKPSQRSINLKDPQGVIHLFTGVIKDFCLEHHLNPGAVSALIHGRIWNHRGWTCPGQDTPEIRNFNLIYDHIGEIISQYESGGSYRGLAIAHGVSPRRLRRIMVEHGCQIRGPGKYLRSRPRLSNPT